MSEITTNVVTFTNNQPVDLGQLIYNSSSNSVNYYDNDNVNLNNSIVYNNPTSIYTSDVSVDIDGLCHDGDNVFTFGPCQKTLFLIPIYHSGTSLSGFLFSVDGINWNLNNQIFSSFAATTVNTIAYNGNIWLTGTINNATTAAELYYLFLIVFDFEYFFL